MKLKHIFAAAVVTASITSCGNSNDNFEKDMGKVAELSCKFSKTMDKSLKLVNESKVKDSAYFKAYRAIEDEMAVLKKEGESLKLEVEKKYPKFQENKEKKAIAEKILKEKMALCKS